jgi:hypothetical protein
MSRACGALVFYGAQGIVVPTAQVGVTAGLVTIVRNATGDWSWNNAAGAATQNYAADNAVFTRPRINFPAPPGQYSTSSGVIALGNDYQEAFGTTPATPGATAPGDPFAGLAAGSVTLPASQFGTPALPWGVALIDVFAVYSVQTAALTAATIAVNRNIFVENTATVNTAVVAPQTLALTTTTSATTPHVQKFTLVQPVIFEMADFSTLVIELAITTAATSAVRVYGIGAHYAVVYS